MSFEGLSTHFIFDYDRYHFQDTLCITKTHKLIFDEKTCFLKRYVNVTDIVTPAITRYIHELRRLEKSCKIFYVNCYIDVMHNKTIDSHLLTNNIKNLNFWTYEQVDRLA